MTKCSGASVRRFPRKRFHHTECDFAKDSNLAKRSHGKQTKSNDWFGEWGHAFEFPNHFEWNRRINSYSAHLTWFTRSFYSFFLCFTLVFIFPHTVGPIRRSKLSTVQYLVKECGANVYMLRNFVNAQYWISAVRCTLLHSREVKKNGQFNTSQFPASHPHFSLFNELSTSSQQCSPIHSVYILGLGSIWEIWNEVCLVLWLFFLPLIRVSGIFWLGTLHNRRWRWNGWQNCSKNMRKIPSRS
jgi:hypothetical protein